jgi:hypothetical protein
VLYLAAPLVMLCYELFIAARHCPTLPCCYCAHVVTAGNNVAIIMTIDHKHIRRYWVQSLELVAIMLLVGCCAAALLSGLLAASWLEGGSSATIHGVTAANCGTLKRRLPSTLAARRNITVE